MPADRVVQVSIAASQRHGADPEDLAIFRPQRHLAGDTTVTLLPYGGGERVCLGKALAELEIRLLAVGLLKQLTLALEIEKVFGWIKQWGGLRQFLPRPQAERAGGTSCAAPKR